MSNIYSSDLRRFLMLQYRNQPIEKITSTKKILKKNNSSGEDYTPHLSDEVETDSDSTDNGTSILDVNLPPVEPILDKNHSSSDAEVSVQRTKISKRLRKADPTTWKRNMLKQRRNLGLSFKTASGERSAKVPQLSDCSQCKFKCNEKFNEEARQALCQSYWSLGSYCKRKEFILRNTKHQEPQCHRPRKENAKLRKNSKQYFFSKQDTPVRVCQKFFLKTLNISNGPVNKAYEQMNDDGSFSGSDMRGKHVPSNKIPENIIKEIKEHIKSFLVTELHYCRESSSQQYLDSSLSVSKLYALFKESWNTQNGEIPSLTTYKRVFTTEFNLYFLNHRKIDMLSVPDMQT